MYPSKTTSKPVWLPLIVWMVVVFFFSTDTFSAANTAGIIKSILAFLFPSMTSLQLDFWHGVIRKVGHVTEYSILALLAWRAFVVHPRVGLKPRLSAAAFVLAFALSDEFHQMFVASRTGSLLDVGYDFVGGAIVLILLPKSKNESGTLHSHSVL